jgi:hypothetical protein
MKMNNQKLNFSLAIIALTLVLLSSCSTSTTNKLPPTITTTAISSIASSTAISGGTITSDGGATITAQGVCWSTATNPTISNNKATSTTGTSTFSSTITGLTGNTTYYARAYATNSEGTSYGNEVTFTTAPPTAPVLTTTIAGSVGATSAISGGNITSDGGSPVTARGICWSTSTGPTVTLTTKTSDSTGAGSFNSNITGLAALTTYYVKAYATNSIGTVYGNEISFTTTAVSANSAGTLSVSTTTSTAGGKYSPKNVVAIWIRTSSGAFVKSLLVYANAQRYDLSNWYSNSSQNTTNATTGATQSSYATRVGSWNGTNTSGTLVADGDYKVCMELCDGGFSYKEFTFTKGPTTVSLTPANTGSFSNIVINWTPK